VAEGVVKWFDHQGHGIITVLALNPGEFAFRGGDVIVSSPDIEMLGYRSLDEGAHVSFAIERDGQGKLHARKVTWLGDSVPASMIRSKPTASRSPRSGFSPFDLLVTLIMLFAAVTLVVFWFR
jgi:cold shock CspA family protein